MALKGWPLCFENRPILFVSNSLSMVKHFRYHGLKFFSSSLFCSQHFSSRAVGLRHLSILYCGSDDFSAVSLRKLNELRLQVDRVKKIEVVCKEGKPSGRGRKSIRAGNNFYNFESGRGSPNL